MAGKQAASLQQPQRPELSLLRWWPQLRLAAPAALEARLLAALAVRLLA